VLLQGAIALALLFTHDVRSVLSNVGAILVLFAALTVGGLFVAKLRGKGEPPSAMGLAAAGVYVLSAGFMFYEGFKRSPSLFGWLALVALLGLGAFALTKRRPA
jgi:hypothetical protein